MAVTVIPQTEGGFLAHRSLLIRAYPKNLSDTHLPWLLSACADPGARVSAEFFFSNDTEDHQLATLLILRAEGPQRREVEARLDRTSRMILTNLRKAGYTAELMDDHPDSTRELLSPFVFFFLPPAKGGDAVTGYYLPDQPPLPEKRQPYLPASWRNHPQPPPLPLQRMLSVLCTYARDGICLQFRHTRMTKDECEELARLTSSAESAEGKKHLATLLEMAGRPVFQVSILASGCPLFLQQLSLLMSSQGFASFQVPYRALPASLGVHLATGLNRLNRLFRVLGHDLRLRNRLTDDDSRLSQLADLSGIRACLTVPTGPTPEFLPTRAAPIAAPVRSARPKNEDSVLSLGVRADTSGKPFELPASSLLRHGVLCGKSGVGKTVVAMGILYQLAHLPSPVPFLVIEPTKTEYRTLLHAVPGLRVYTPGKQDSGLPLPLNPFVPPRGITRAQYIPCLKDIFAMSISMDAFLKNAFAEVITSCYNLYGWQEDSTRDSPSVTHFGMHEFIREFRRYTRDEIRNQESRDNVENGGVIRLMNLINTDAFLFDTIETPDWEDLLRHPVLIELNALPSQEEKALVFAILMKNLDLVVHQRTEHSSALRNVIMIDEVHVLLDRSPGGGLLEDAAPGAACTAMLQDMTLTYRSLGLGLLFGDQSPVTLGTLFNQVNLRVIMRIDSGEDLRRIADTVSFDAAICSEIPRLDVGYAYVHRAGMENPVCICGINWETELNLPSSVPDSELLEVLQPHAGRPFLQCQNCPACLGGCLPSRRIRASALAEYLLRQEPLHGILRPEENAFSTLEMDLAVYLSRRFPEEYEKALRERQPDSPPDPGLLPCTRLQLIRKLLISGLCPLPEDRLWGMIPALSPEPTEKKEG